MVGNENVTFEQIVNASSEQNVDTETNKDNASVGDAREMYSAADIEF